MKTGCAFIERGRRGFAREDVWSFDLYLAKVIAGGCAELAERMNGCPPELCEDGDVDLGCQRWKEILDEIALGFRLYHEADARFGVEPPKELERSFDLLRRWWGHIWD